jgi:hypothetical protein
MAMPWRLPNSKPRRPPHSEPRPTIELMRSININESRRVIPRYSNAINEPKPKWTRRKTYQRIRNQIQSLEAKAKTRRFRKPIPTQLLAYHVA